MKVGPSDHSVTFVDLLPFSSFSDTPGASRIKILIKKSYKNIQGEIRLNKKLLNMWTFGQCEEIIPAYSVFDARSGAIYLCKSGLIN